jgi:hypothetical protein
LDHLCLGAFAKPSLDLFARLSLQFHCKPQVRIEIAIPKVSGQSPNASPFRALFVINSHARGIVSSLGVDFNDNA